MTEIPQELTEAYSKGDLSRRDIGERVGRPVGFGELLALLHERRLPLPRYPSDPHSPGVPMIERLSARAAPPCRMILPPN